MEATMLPAGNDSLVSIVQDTPAEERLPGIVSDRVLEVMTFVNFGILTSIVVIFGTVANIINAIVYYRIGFKEPINISLGVLAISDLGCCFSLFLFALCYNPIVRQMDLPFDPDDLIYFPGCIHNIFARVTSITTTLITVERCMCVVIPLKVKQIVTPRRVTIFLSCATVFIVASIAPHFYTARHKFHFNSQRNKSILILTFIEDRENIDNKLFIIHSIFIPIFTLLVVVIATVVLVVSLRQKTKWRANVTNTASTNANNLSIRDAKISQMVIFIAAVFIIAYLPVTISYTATLFEPEYYLKKRYHNLFHMMFSFHFVLQAINSCLNIFIYYSMSSAYKAIFHDLFGIRKEQTGKREQTKT